MEVVPRYTQYLYCRGMTEESLKHNTTGCRCDYDNQMQESCRSHMDVPLSLKRKTILTLYSHSIENISCVDSTSTSVDVDGDNGDDNNDGDDDDDNNDDDNKDEDGILNCNPISSSSIIFEERYRLHQFCYFH